MSARGPAGVGPGGRLGNRSATASPLLPPLPAEFASPRPRPTARPSRPAEIRRRHAQLRAWRRCLRRPPPLAGAQLNRRRRGVSSASCRRASRPRHLRRVGAAPQANEVERVPQEIVSWGGRRPQHKSQNGGKGVENRYSVTGTSEPGHVTRRVTIADRPARRTPGGVHANIRVIEKTTSA